jgi:hypothetical protein
MASARFGICPPKTRPVRKIHIILQPEMEKKVRNSIKQTRCNELQECKLNIRASSSKTKRQQWEQQSAGL